MRDLGNKQVMSRNLKRLMAERKVSAKELSKRLDFPYTTVLSWLKADNYPRIDKIEAMADYFGVLKSELIEEKIADAIEKNPVKMAELHFEMIEDIDLQEIFEEFRSLNERDRQTVKDLVHSLANTKTEA